MAPEQLAQVKQGAEGGRDGIRPCPKVKIFDVTGHSLGIAVEGVKFHRIITKESVIPITQSQAGFTNAADFTTELLVEVYQGEEEYVAANTKVGEVRIQGLEPLPRGQHVLEVKFTLDASGTLSTVCTDLRTRRAYEGSFMFDGITRMDEETIKKNRELVMQAMAGAYGAPAGTQDGPPPTAQTQPPRRGRHPRRLCPKRQRLPSKSPPPGTPFGRRPKPWRAGLPPDKRGPARRGDERVRQAVAGGGADVIEDKAYILQDTIYEVGS